MLNDFDYDRLPTEPLGFGKYRNKTWTQIQAQDPGYLNWLKGSDFGRGDQTIIDVITSLQSTLVAKVDYDLMPDQQLAVDYFREQCLEGGHRVFRLNGGAGYGKSYAVTMMAKAAMQAGWTTITGIAASYVATQVLAESLDPVNAESKTIARALGLQPNKTAYRESYGPSQHTDTMAGNLLEQDSMLIVDEYSMADDTVVDIVYRAMNDNQNNSILMVVGDEAQLPSPAQEHMCAFNTISPWSNLTIPKRFQPDSPLHRVEMGVRADPWVMSRVLTEQQTGSSVMQHVGFDAMVRQQIQDLEAYPEESGLMLFYRRDQVAKANRNIRGIVYGQDAPDIVDGERLRVMRTTFLPTIWDNENNKWVSQRHYSGTFLTAAETRINAVKVSFHHTDLPANDMPDLEVVCHTVEHDNVVVPVVFSKTEHQADPETFGGPDFNQALGRITAYCQEHEHDIRGVWRLYHFFRSNFIQVSYGYATTVHRSQGASVDRVYLCPRDVLQGGDYMARRLAYVAATRAKQQLNFYI